MSNSKFIVRFINLKYEFYKKKKKLDQEMGDAKLLVILNNILNYRNKK